GSAGRRSGHRYPAPHPKKPGKGDVLTLKTGLADWPTPLDLASEDVYTRVTNADGDLVLLRARAGRFRTRGKTTRVRDTDGTAIQVFAGHKESGALSAGCRGMVTLVWHRGGTALTL